MANLYESFNLEGIFGGVCTMFIILGVIGGVIGSLFLSIIWFGLSYSYYYFTNKK